MRIVGQGTLASSQSGTSRATLTFPCFSSLADGTVLACWRCGTTKDSEDETIECCRSPDNGVTWGTAWRPFGNVQVGGKRGSLKHCQLTEVSPRRLLAACLWVDRESFPGRPLFDPKTEGCLPMAVVLADSRDGGKSWSDPKPVSLPEELGPPSLTNPILRLASGELAMSVETNKSYVDTARWMQKAVLLHSSDGGASWQSPIASAEDPAGRIFYWDQRAGVSPDGRIATFLWTFDHDTARYLSIRRRISNDNGRSWSAFEDLGFSDQPSHPAILQDGRTVLGWVDRFGSRSIRARLAPDVGAAFDPGTELVIYQHDAPASRTGARGAPGELLAEMSLWSFGLPFADALPDGTVLVLYYAGSEHAMDIRWCRIAP